eukprot:CAMPEP_0119531830 /NCGR_PEP_ID=MMETSP1344-20130328/45462_1 /TAXON_ID=236787 /ORGANISM="Florenciella parvula, Strain CCMP2471" /LENGTH=46 /DNA_ID= /DNA_START= /DNA_END= /DNA_ORIENTATION=
MAMAGRLWPVGYTPAAVHQPHIHVTALSHMATATAMQPHMATATAK